MSTRTAAARQTTWTRVHALTDLMSDEDTEEQVELVKVDLARAVRIEHIEHVVDLLRLEVGHVVYHLVELDVCRVYIPQQQQSASTNDTSFCWPALFSSTATTMTTITPSYAAVL